MHIPLTPPKVEDLLHEAVKTDMLQRILEEGSGVMGDYLHWDKLRHLTTPEGLSHEQWWLGLKLARTSAYRPLALRAIDKSGFRYVLTDTLFEKLHQIDKAASGAIAAADEVTNPNTRDTYLFKSLVEESITSSQLEGASTTRAVAKDMIASGREPRNVSERMIWNNYQAMRFIREIRTEPLTPSIVIELQRILTDSTLRESDAVGRLRRYNEPINVQDVSGKILHVPPPADELNERLKAMCAFANEGDSKPFLHPVLRAIFLHFWLAYDHPFIDGNGRTARALFYWCMANRGFWLTEFISISRIIKEQPAQYAKSFLLTETDDNDATYFFESQLSVIERAIRNLHTYLKAKTKELYETEQLFNSAKKLNLSFNHRQMALLHHALKNPYHAYTVESHQRSHNISNQTSRNDLEKLNGLNTLDRKQQGKAFVFLAPPDLKLRITQLVDKP